MKPFDEAAGQLLDELLRIYRVWGRHRATCDLSGALRKAREEGRAALAAELKARLSASNADSDEAEIGWFRDVIDETAARIKTVAPPEQQRGGRGC